ncbi:hypothetical protein IKE88_00935 [Candidatus Saccharibacteria bacterium]|nr:hypothetical protein [Candidatus Saccharibacteria bacterium]
MAEEKKATKATKTTDTKKETSNNKPLIIGIVAVAVVAVATFIILGVCGVFGSKVPPAGEYELVDMIKDGESQSSMISLMKAFGVSPSLTINSDKTGKMNITGEGEAEEVTFTDTKIKSKSTGEETDYTFKDGKVTIKAEDEEMVFQKK